MENYEEYLKQINNSIWNIPNTKGNSTIKTLTEEEWTKIKQILFQQLDNGEIVIEMTTFHFGFTCGLWISKIIEPTFPGIPFAFETLLAVSAKHLFGESGPTFEQGWKEFSTLSHSQQNLKTLKRVGKKLPGSKSYYEY